MKRLQDGTLNFYHSRLKYLGIICAYGLAACILTFIYTRKYLSAVYLDWIFLFAMVIALYQVVRAAQALYSARRPVMGIADDTVHFGKGRVMKLADIISVGEYINGKKRYLKITVQNAKDYPFLNIFTGKDGESFFGFDSAKFSKAERHLLLEVFKDAGKLKH